MEDINELEDKMEVTIRPTFFYIYDGCLILACCLGIIVDILTAYTIATNKRLHKSRAHLLLMNWCISDALGLTFRPTLITIISDALIEDSTTFLPFCILRHVDIAFGVATVAFAHLLLIQIKSRIQFWTVYMFVAILAIVNGTLCKVLVSYVPIYVATALVLLLYVALLVSLWISECCKVKKDKFRMDSVRIFVYTWFISGLFDITLLPRYLPIDVVAVCQLINLLGEIVSVYVLVYLVIKDEAFKVCFLNLFRRKKNSCKCEKATGFAVESVDSSKLQDSSLTLNAP